MKVQIQKAPSQCHDVTSHNLIHVVSPAEDQINYTMKKKNPIPKPIPKTILRTQKAVPCRVVLKLYPAVHHCASHQHPLSFKSTIPDSCH